MSSAARRFLGIYVSDEGPGSSISVALALVSGQSLEYSSTISVRDGKKEGSDLRSLQKEFGNVLRDLAPEVVVLRGRGVRRGPWEKLRKGVHAEGVLLAAAADAKIDCVMETGATIRATVGYNRATVGSKTSTAVNKLVSGLAPPPPSWAAGEAAAAALAEMRQRE